MTDAKGALASILLVALIIGTTLGAIFWPLMEFERLSGNEREYRIWLIEWVAADVLLTAWLCRREVRSLIR
ncbi:MAG: hypothetical protein HYY26_06645 [Acidobacteria bacterium]|nr:hypothetical protein [Acidobacteriota bacterium]